jgi:16S rRNA (uracil1498-N3)-methyltransferase
MNIFLVDQTSDPVINLSEEESYHCIKVLRMQEGDSIIMTDGKGFVYNGVIEEANAKACSVKVLKKEAGSGKRNYYLHVAIAPTKNIDRLEWFLEKATEIGVDEITPLICQRSERKEVKIERLNKVIVSAMKQSLKVWLPKLNAPKSFADFVSVHHSSQKFICSFEAQKSSLIKNHIHQNENVLLLIGPEGDFTPDEILMAEKYGFIQLSLGESRLRTETAGIVACSQIAMLNG